MAAKIPGRLWPTALIGLILAGALSLALGKAQRHVDALARMRAAPRADLAHPAQGPAIYPGRLRGPEGRVEPLGRSVAAHWWWVDERVSKNNWKNVCFRREISGLRLSDQGREVGLPFFDGTEGLSLLGPGRSDDLTDRLIVDLGYEQRSVQKTMPAAAASCGGKSREWIGRSIPPGAGVELLACMEAGELRPCPGHPAVVLVVGTMKDHRGRRADLAATPFITLGLVSLVPMVLLLAYAIYTRQRMFEIVSPRRTQ